MQKVTLGILARPRRLREKRPCPRAFYTPPAPGKLGRATTATPSSTPTRSSANADHDLLTEAMLFAGDKGSRCLTRRAVDFSADGAHAVGATTQCSSSAAATACRATRERSGACSRATRCRRFFSSTRAWKKSTTLPLLFRFGAQAGRRGGLSHRARVLHAREPVYPRNSAQRSSRSRATRRARQLTWLKVTGGARCA